MLFIACLALAAVPFSLPNGTKKANVLIAYQKAVKLAEDGDAQKATEFFYDILMNAPNDSVIDNMYEDIKEILTQEQKKAFKRAKNKALWLLHFWRSLDPTPATPANEGLVEHYQRLKFVKRKYRCFLPRGYDDRGLVYLKYGPPDDKYISSMGETTRDNESWVYHRLGDVSFDFVEFGGIYYSVEDLRRALASVPSDFRAQLYLWMQLFDERSDLDLNYQITAAALRKSMQDLARGIRPNPESIIQHEYIVRNYEKKLDLPEHASDFRMKEKPLSFIVAEAAFLPEQRTPFSQPFAPSSLFPAERTGAAGKASRLELYYALLLKKLNTKKLFNAKRPANMILAFAVYNKSHDLLLQKEDSLQLDLSA
ncbi:MAG: GWxTD domain-containing protein, partial [Calditrichaeota bacterium]